MSDPTEVDGPQPAPRGRQLASGLMDAALMAAGTALYWRMRWRGGQAGAPQAAPPAWVGLLWRIVAVAAQQVGSPGAWIMGLRTVDRRTGRRPALWRTLVIVLAAAAMEALARRIVPRPAVPSGEERKRQWAEVEAIRQRHLDDPDAANEDLMRHYSEHRVDVRVNVAPLLAAGLGRALINSRLRRRLAPTVVVLRRRGAQADAEPHSP